MNSNYFVQISLYNKYNQNNPNPPEPSIIINTRNIKLFSAGTWVTFSNSENQNISDTYRISTTGENSISKDLILSYNSFLVYDVNSENIYEDQPPEIYEPDEGYIYSINNNIFNISHTDGTGRYSIKTYDISKSGDSRIGYSIDVSNEIPESVTGLVVVHHPNYSIIPLNVVPGSPSEEDPPSSEPSGLIELNPSGTLGDGKWAVSWGHVNMEADGRRAWIPDDPDGSRYGSVEENPDARYSNSTLAVYLTASTYRENNSLTWKQHKVTHYYYGDYDDEYWHPEEDFGENDEVNYWSNGVNWSIDTTNNILTISNAINGYLGLLRKDHATFSLPSSSEQHTYGQTISYSTEFEIYTTIDGTDYSIGSIQAELGLVWVPTNYII